MEKQAMKLSRESYPAKKPTERVLQFGEGNFLRCFVDWQLDILNEKQQLDAGVVVVRPIASDFPPSLNTQDGLYTTIVRGYDEQGVVQEYKRVITSVCREIAIYQEHQAFLETAGNPDIRYIVSNTTEAGIVFVPGDALSDTPPSSYPAKLTQWLYERFMYFHGAVDKGLYIIPCELIDYNGETLKSIVLDYCRVWELPEDFKDWLEQANYFCSTLVDRIVTGYPKDEIDKLQEDLGYQDAFITTGEYFHLFVIQGPQQLKDELKLEGSNLHIQMVEDLKPYKVRKVGILNGAHTSLVPVGFLAGIDLVKDAVEDAQLCRFLDELIQKEIIPNLGLPIDYAQEFASSVIDRFKNPFIKHQLHAIALNSMTKFKTRVLPQMLTYIKTQGTIPTHMAFSLAALLCYYRGVRQISNDADVLITQRFQLQDNPEFLDLFRNLWKEDEPLTHEHIVQVAHTILSLESHWGVNLAELPELERTIITFMDAILFKGVRMALNMLLNA